MAPLDPPTGHSRPPPLSAEESVRPDSHVRQRLRHATSTVHEALHRHSDFVSLLEERISLPDYRALLARLHGFQAPLEHGLRDASPDVLRGLNLQACARTPALRADLRALGMSEPEIDALPVCDRLGSVRSHPELLGRLYVVEGSALGGRLMASRLDGLLGPGRTEGRQFFYGRSAPDPLPWPAFCRLLEAGEVRSDIDAVIESAGTTFNALAHWLSKEDADV